MNRIAHTVGRGTFWLSAGNVIVKVTGLLYLIVLLGHLSVAEYGLSKLALSIPALLGIFNLAGLNNVMIVDMLSHKMEKRYKEMSFLLGSYISAKAIAGLTAFVLLVAARLLFQDAFSEEILNLVLILSVFFLLSPFRALVTLSLEMSKRFKSRTSLDVLDEIMKLILVYVLLSWFGLGVLGVVLATVVSGTVSTLLYVPTAASIMSSEIGGRFMPAGLLQPMSIFKSHAKWSVFLDSLSSFSLNMRPWIIEFLLGLNAVGVYGIATSLLNPLKNIVPIGRVILPIVPDYTGDKSRVIKIINSAMKYKLYAQLILSGVAFALLPLFFNFFPDYRQAQGLFVALTLMFVPNAALQMFGVAFQVFKMQKNMFFAAVINFFVVAALLPVLIAVFGLYGIAIELFITQCLYVFVRLKSLRVTLPGYRLPFKDIFSFTTTDRWLLQKVFQKIRLAKKV